jgi:hypothetical protein
MRARERGYAELMLRLLLGGAVAPLSGDVDWALWQRLAQQNRVIVRLAGRLSHARWVAPAFAEAAAQEGARAQTLYAVTRRVDEACTRWRIPHVFLKANRHYPDAGRDVDLLVPRDATRIDGLLVSDLQATPRPTGLGDRVAASTSFRLDGDVTLDVHHGRLGLCGEQRWLADFLLERGRPIEVAGGTVWGLSPGDEVLLQGVQLVRGRGSFRMAEPLYTIGAARGHRLDWEELIGSARRLGALTGLSCYLTYVARIHEQLFAQDLLPDTVARLLRPRGWGTVEFKNAAFHFPGLAVSARVYLAQLGADIVARRWESVRRLSLLPLVGAAAGLRRLRASSPR